MSLRVRRLDIQGLPVVGDGLVEPLIELERIPAAGQDRRAPDPRENREQSDRDRQERGVHEPLRDEIRIAGIGGRAMRVVLDGEGEVFYTPGRLEGEIDAMNILRATLLAMRRAGASYEEIARAGGGIASTVARTRAASASELIAGARGARRTGP